MTDCVTAAVAWMLHGGRREEKREEWGGGKGARQCEVWHGTCQSKSNVHQEMKCKEGERR